MADDATTPTTVTFRRNHLVRLHGFDHAALDGKLVRIESDVDDATGKFEVAFLNDQARPPIPLNPARRMWIKPEHFSHACEYCLIVASAAVDGGRLQMCGRCKTARYCNAECQRADWVRHKESDCIHFAFARGSDAPLFQACMAGNDAEVRRLVEEEEADVNKALATSCIEVPRTSEELREMAASIAEENRKAWPPQVQAGAPYNSRSIRILPPSARVNVVPAPHPVPPNANTPRPRAFPSFIASAWGF